MKFSKLKVKHVIDIYARRFVHSVRQNLRIENQFAIVCETLGLYKIYSSVRPIANWQILTAVTRETAQALLGDHRRDRGPQRVRDHGRECGE